MSVVDPVQASYHVACDLGASSGRVILGCFGADRKLTIGEVHRFPNGPLRVAGTLRWNVLGLYREILTSLRLAAAKAPGIASVSVDSWGGGLRPGGQRPRPAAARPGVVLPRRPRGRRVRRTVEGRGRVRRALGGDGHPIHGLQHAHSFPIRVIPPLNRKRWDRAANRFAKLELFT